MPKKTNIDAGQSLWKDAWLRLKKNRMAVVSAIVIGLIFLLWFIAPAIFSFQDPNTQDRNNTFAPVSGQHLLGTDQSGRDLLSRLVYGGRISLLVGFVATAVSLVIGILWCIRNHDRFLQPDGNRHPVRIAAQRRNDAPYPAA
jgi:oligopeptide transport system permease protein